MNTHIKYLAALLIVMLAPLARAQNFSADSITHTTSGKIYRGKLYRANNMVRAETFIPTTSSDAVVLIVDLDKQVGYTISAREKSYIVGRGRSELHKVGLAVPAGMDPCTPTDASPEKHFSCKRVGEEVLNGRHIEKIEITGGRNGLGGVDHAWFDPHLHTVVRVESGTSTVELQNIQEGPQSPSLFVVPSDYREVNVGAR